MPHSMDAQDVALLRESLTGVVRTARDLRADVLGLGWDELLAEAPDVAVSVLFALQGSELTPGTLLDDVLCAAAGVEHAAVVLPPLSRSEPASAVHDDRVRVDGVVSSAGTAPERVLVPVTGPDGVQLRLLPWQGDWPSEGTGLAPGSGWAALSTELPAGEVVGDDAAFRAMQAAGRRALAHELVALGSAMLRMTVEHVTTRRQFGRALAQFQVVKHKLADVRTWQEVAVLAAEAAWEDGGASDVECQSALLAKTTASRFTRAARVECQQLLGGMGFSWEHDFHLHLRRALVLEAVLGSAASLRAELGADLRATGRLPALAAL